MADLLFSTYLDVGSEENVTKALAIYNEVNAALDPDNVDDYKGDYGDLVTAYRDFGGEFDYGVGFDIDPGSRKLWIHSDEELGHPDGVVLYVKKVAQVLKLNGKWGFTWAVTCCDDEWYNGGAFVIDFATGEHEEMATYDWLQEKLGKANDND